MRLSRTLTLVLAVLPLAFAIAGCDRAIDVPKSLQVTDLTTGWYDAGIIKSPEGDKNKLVPTIAFRLKNVSDSAITTVQLNTVFRRLGEPEEWDSASVKGIGAEGLAPGASTPPIVIRSSKGYTGPQPRMQMLQNRDFVDATVELFAKYHAQQWARLGDFRIQRQLLTQ
jgi:hypothetical protein